MRYLSRVLFVSAPAVESLATLFAEGDSLIHPMNAKFNVMAL